MSEDHLSQDAIDLELARIENLLLAHPWRFAKTMAETPHWYTLRKEWADQDAFDFVVLGIRRHGYRAKHSKTYYTYINFGGLRYWTMGSPLNNTILINRTYLDDEEALRQGALVMGGRPSMGAGEAKRDAP